MKAPSLRILVSLDGSVESESVFAALMPVVRHLPAEITLVHVVPDMIHAAGSASSRNVPRRSPS